MAKSKKDIIKYAIIQTGHNRIGPVGCKALSRANWQKLIEIDLCNNSFNKQIIYWEPNVLNI